MQVRHLFSSLSTRCRRHPRIALIALAAVIVALVAAQRLLPCLFRQFPALHEISPPRPIPAIPKNLSGLTWNEETATLFAVTNQPELVFELTPQGQVLRQVRLRGFEDTEGIAHIKGTLFAVVEERRAILDIFHIPDNATEVDHTGAQRLQLGPEDPKNKGFESLAYDPGTRTLHTMREGRPFVRLSIPLDGHFRPGSIQHSPLPELNVRDVASVIREPDGTLWILSEKSSCIVLLGGDGRVLRTFKLDVDPESFRPEGITRAPDGRIFLVGEPNILAEYALPH